MIMTAILVWGPAILILIWTVRRARQDAATAAKAALDANTRALFALRSVRKVGAKYGAIAKRLDLICIESVKTDFDTENLRAATLELAGAIKLLAADVDQLIFARDGFPGGAKPLTFTLPNNLDLGGTHGEANGGRN